MREIDRNLTMLCVALGHSLTWKVYKAWEGDGGIGVLNEIAAHAEQIDMLANEIAQKGANNPDVFLYVVPDEFGEYFNRVVIDGIYDEVVAKKKMGEIMFAYFAQYPENIPLIEKLIFEKTGYKK